MTERNNQSIKIYIAPLQDPYSEALQTQAKRKRTVLRRWWNREQIPFGRCLRSIGSPFHVVGPTTEKHQLSFIHIQHLYSTSSRELLRGAHDSSKAKKSSVKERKKRR